MPAAENADGDSAYHFQQFSCKASLDEASADSFGQQPSKMVGAILVNLAIILHVILVPLYVYLTWHWKYWEKRGVITAKPLRLLGSFPAVLTRHRNIAIDVHEVYTKYKKSKARAIGVFLTRKPELLVLDPKLGSEIMVTNFRNFQNTLTSALVTNRKKDKYVSRNPFWAQDEYWKKYRTEGLPALTQNRLKQAYPIWRSSCAKLHHYLSAKTANGPAQLSTSDLAFRFTSDTMCDFIWGIEQGALDPLKTDTTTIMDVSVKWLAHTFNTLSLGMATTVAPWIRRVWQYRFYAKETDDFFAKLTKDAVQVREQQPQPDRADVLNHLLELRERKGLSIDDMVGHSLVVMLDGFETTGVALSHTLYYLSMNPKAQQRLREEILEKLKEVDNDHLDFATLNSLPYMDQCVQETARMLTLVPLFLRVCTKACSLEVAPGQTVNIEEGTLAIVPIYSYHHDEEYYPEPYKYNPDRFDNGKQVECTKNGILLPFGDGPRICIGMRAGLLTIKAALVEILSQFEVFRCDATPGEDAISPDRFVLTLEGAIPLQYRKLLKVD